MTTIRIRDYNHGGGEREPAFIEPLEPLVDEIAEEDQPQYLIDACRERRLAIYAPGSDPYVWSSIDLGDVLAWTAENHPELLVEALKAVGR